MRGLTARPRVAIVHDWLISYAGSERVLREIIECFPEADVFALIDFLPLSDRAWLGGRTVTPSFLQRFPWSRRFYQKLLPLMPAAIEALDLRKYDLILSSTSGISKGVLTEPRQLHICYLHSRSLRYLYEERFSYGRRGVLGRMQDILTARLRVWDSVSAQRPDHTIANSEFVSSWHRRRHRVAAPVIYPPVDTARFGLRFACGKEDFYIVVSRLEPYKHVSVVVEAFSRLGIKLVVVGSGSQLNALRRTAEPNVKFAGSKNADEVADLVSRARALIVAAREDFGIAAVEAQACGTPVIAFSEGGASEIVCGLESDSPTGVLFHAQTADSLIDAVRRFEVEAARIHPDACCKNADRFSTQRFRDEYTRFVLTRWAEFAGTERA